MEIKYFRLIKTIAEEGNIANSSERLFLTQSALSHQLREIEERLGFKVFYRSRNNWKLTEEGTELYKTGDELLEILERGFNSIQKIRTGSKGAIKVSTECYSFYQGLPAFIQKMAVLYPEIEIDLILDATHQPITKVLSHNIDIALVTSLVSTTGLTVIPLFEDEIFAVMHKENCLYKQEYLSAADFSDTHLIIHSFPIETVSVYQQFLSPDKIVPAKISAIPLTEVSLEMISANMGISCIPKWTLKSFRLSEDLRFKRIGKNGLKRTHYLVLRKEDRKKKYIDDFISTFEDEFVKKNRSIERF
ncbi:LysR family transcriptional regulator [Aquimarina sp. RZ0]|uniref:LysR family transcriptional regulator n=1 Tax=Aquimarina sp. RZ0 TaxID=2607730 RepID=UPI0011F3E1E4|nr:LysR substrate-binding domain-containing protein [Aquimarina sp. RZ0]KAA1247623.1 LysR family transcriptional regulator [Aquimarina sp. RZ0]